MIIKVNISEEESIFVREKFYKYNSLLAVLAYLNNNSNNSDFLEKKFDVATEACIELEMAKAKYSQKYAPVGKKLLNYTFDFDNNLIVYEIEE